MMRVVTAVSAVLFVGCLVGCGGSPTDPTRSAKNEEPLTFPTVVPVGSTCGPNTSAIYFIWGLSNLVRNPQAKPLAATLKVGESARLSFDFSGCGGGSDEMWTSTNPGVAAISPDDRLMLNSVVLLTGLIPGETQVFVDFQGPDRQRHRTYPAYCPASIYLCIPPRTPIAVVRVVAQ